MNYFEAALNNDIIAMKDYLKFGDINQVDDKGNSFLHYAVRGNSMEVAILLLENYINPNIYNNNSETPIYIAMQSGHTGMIKLLLRYKASLDCKNKNGETILFRVILSNRIDLIRLMIASHNYDIYEKNNNDENILHYAIKANNTEIIYNVLKKDPKLIYSKNYHNVNLLCYAIYYNNFDLVKFFSKYISIYECDNDYDNAIYYAARYGSATINTYLLSTFKPIVEGKNRLGENINQLIRRNMFDVSYVYENYIFSRKYMNYKEEFPYHVATISRDEYILSHLPKKYEKKDSNSKTILDLALEQGISYVIELIKESTSL